MSLVKILSTLVVILISRQINTSGSLAERHLLKRAQQTTGSAATPLRSQNTNASQHGCIIGHIERRACFKKS